MEELPFETSYIYISDLNKYYRLNSDFSKKEVSENEMFQNSDKEIVVISKKSFDLVKSELLDKDSIIKLSKEEALTYFKIGFLTKDEYEDFIRE